MELSTYFNYDLLLHQNPISEIYTNNNNFIEPTQEEELAQNYYYHNNNNNNILPYSDETFLFDPNTFLDPFFYSDPNGFLCSDENLVHPASDNFDDQLLNFTPYYDPFMFSLNDIFQTDQTDCFNTILPCPKRQKCFHHENQKELIPDGFVPNPCTLPQTEELLFSASSDQFTPVPQFPLQGCEFVIGDSHSEKNGNNGNGSGNGDEQRTISAQSIAARERRRKITEKTQELGKLVPGGPKMNTAEMLNAASKYVKFLQAQVGMLQFMNTFKEEDKEAPPSEENLQALVASPFVQEKLYSEELCFVPKEFITTLVNHSDVQSRPNILKDLKQLIGTDIEEKKKKEQQ